MGRTQRYRSFEMNGKMKYSLDMRLQCYIALNTQMAGMHITQTNQAQTARYRLALRQYSIKHEERVVSCSTTSLILENESTQVMMQIQIRIDP